MKTTIKVTILALIGAASSVSGHELRGAVKAIGDTADFFPKGEMIAESEDEDEAWWGDDDFTGRRGGRGRDGRGKWRGGIRRTDHGQPYWKRSSARGSGGWKRSASAKRQGRRNARRRDRDRRFRCRRCDIEEFMDKHGLEKEDATLLADFYQKFGEDEVDFITDFLNESDSEDYSYN